MALTLSEFVVDERQNGRNPHRAKVAIEGRVKRDTEPTKKELGKIGYPVWRLSLRWRDRDGITHSRQQAYADKLGLTLRQVRRAIARLERVGVWVFVGYAPVKSKEGGSIPIHIVYGQYLDGQITFPSRIARALDRLPKRGGARPGAGRPVGTRKDRGNNQKRAGLIDVTPGNPSENNQNRAGLDNQNRAGPNASDPEIKTGQVKNQKRAGLKSKAGRSNSQNPGFEAAGDRETGVSRPYRDRDIRTATRTDLSYERSVLAAPRAAASEPSSSRPPSTSVDNVVPLRRWKGKPRPRDWEVPLHPSNQRMKVPRTPNPPKLPDDLSDLELAKKEIQAFRAAAKSRKCGSPIPQMTDEELVKSKYYKRLVDAAHAHQDHEIAPMAWCAFAIDAWRDKQRQRRRRGDQPAFGFVFSANFIREKRGWFRSQAGNYGGGRPQVSPECRDVQNRWRAATTFYRRARHQLLETGTTRDYGAPDELTPEGVKAFLEQIEFELFETHFPGGWEGWYEKAIAANEAYAEKLKIAVARGEFVWST